MRRRLVPGIACAWTAALLLLAFAALAAEARPGGGQGYSGGGSSRSSGSSSHSSSSSSSGGSSSTSRSGGGGGDSPTVIIVFLCAFVGMGALVVIAMVRSMWTDFSQKQSWDSSSCRQTDFGILGLVRQQDPDFSVVLFEDFTYALFARAHKARHSDAALAELSPYLTEDVRGHLLGRPPVGSPVRAAVVGSQRIASEVVDTKESRVTLFFEANLVVAAPGGELTQYVRESWHLRRPAGVRTRPWKGVRTFGCPACGAPLESGASSLCAACGQRVDDGRFDWMVRRIEVEKVETLPPSLTGTVEESGTDLGTVFSPGLATRRDALLSDDPAFTLEALQARLRLIFEELQKAWAAQDLSGVRPYVSAGLYQYLDYWVSAYRTQGLRNEVEGATLEKSQLVRVVRDACYDSLTFRIWGSGRDFTVRVTTGEVVAGSRTKDRKYTEYWTLIRGAKVRGAPRADRACPACGAAVKVGMEGNCAYCGALVTSGDFDWVLSRIEQDDSYTG